jgi:hypothetical protein
MTQGALRKLDFPRRRRLTAAIVCAGLPLLAAGCGSSASSSSTNAGDPVAYAAAASSAAPGYKMTMKMKISSPALPQPITASGTGSFNIPERAGTFNLAMDFSNQPQVAQALGSSTFNVQEIIKAPLVYVKLPASVAQKIPGGKPWMKIDVSKLGAAAGIPGLSSVTSNPASSDPSQFLQYLRAVSGSITKVGSQDIGGVPTTHYRATINLDKVPDALPAAQRKGAQQAIAALEKQTNLHELPVEVWIDGHHLVRQMQLAFAENAGGQNVNTQITLGIPEYGPQPAPVLPPDSQVNDLGALLGAAGAAGSTTTS